MARHGRMRPICSMASSIWTSPWILPVMRPPPGSKDIKDQGVSCSSSSCLFSLAFDIGYCNIRIYIYNICYCIYIYIHIYTVICILDDIQPIEVRIISRCSRPFLAPLQVVSWIKRIMNCEKTGHSGTLDPKATARACERVMVDGCVMVNGVMFFPWKMIEHAGKWRNMMEDDVLKPSNYLWHPIGLMSHPKLWWPGLWMLAGVLEPGYTPCKSTAICRKRVRPTLHREGLWEDLWACCIFKYCILYISYNIL